jgi:hypothetical protein
MHNNYNFDFAKQIGTQDTGRRQAHTKHRKHKENGTYQNPGVNTGVLEVLSFFVDNKKRVMLFKMCWSPIYASIHNA